MEARSDSQEQAHPAVSAQADSEGVDPFDSRLRVVCRDLMVLNLVEHARRSRHYYSPECGCG